MQQFLFEDEAFKNCTCATMSMLEIEFENCTFSNCDFSNGNLSNSKFIECEFINCNMTMAKLTNCVLNTVSFKECKLMGINFSDCVDMPFFVGFKACVMDYCVFTKKKMVKTSFVQSLLKGADFSECDLTKSDFSETNLLNTVFSRTLLKEANFLTAKNYIIDPEMNMIKKAKFSMYGLSGLLNKYDIAIE